MSYRPIGIMTDCGNDYGVAMVRDGDNPAVRADIDFNAGDGTDTARIRVNGNWVNVDEAFVSSYRGMRSTRALGTESRTASCHAISGSDPIEEPDPNAPPDPGISRIHPFWLVSVPTLSIAGAYTVNRLARADLLTASTEPGTVGTILDLGYGGTNGLYSMTLTPFTRHSDPGWAYGMGGVNAAAGLGFFIASFTQPHGQGTPELSTGLSLLTNGGLVFVYGDRVSGRDPVRFYTGFGLQLALGGVGLGTGLAGVGRSEPVGDRPMIAPPGMAGARGVDNPAAGPRFPGIDRDLTWLGIGHVLGAGVNLIDYNWISRAGENRYHLNFAPTAGGGVATVSGTF